MFFFSKNKIFINKTKYVDKKDFLELFKHDIT